MWDAFKQVIFDLLMQIEQVVGDWGLAIIILTVFVRIALLPLTIKQTRSMYELQRIQPKIKELQKKYKDDKEKLQEETLKFYQDNKVNPFGGCLPTIIQMPLLFALYQVLGGTESHPGLLLKYFEANDVSGSFYGLIPDITGIPQQVFSEQGILASVPYLILVVLFALSIWLPQALMPGDKQQKMIGGYMAIMMLYFGWIAPAGVLLYWDISSIWGVAQQQIMIAYMKKTHAGEEESTPVVADEKPLSKKKKSNKK